MTAEEIAKALGGKRSGKGWSCRCPAHDDKNASFSITEGNKGSPVFHCHAGCTQEQVMDALRRKGLWHEPSDEWRESKKRADEFLHGKRQRRIVATYDYTDAAGTLLYQAVRYEPKDFRQRQPIGKDIWVWNLDGVQRVLYRLPELLKHPAGTVFVCEGEKDADRVAALEHCTTTVASGSWSGVDVTSIAGRDALILEDADKPGEKKSRTAAQALHGIANSIRIVRLPGHEHTAKDHGKDVSDWLDEDPANAEKLAEVCFAAPLWTPDEKPSGADGEDGGPSEWDTGEGRPPLRWINMSTWDRDPIPERKWAILNRVPLNQAGLFSGEGGTGKSIIEMTKDVAHVAAKDWYGSLPEPGPAFYIGAEDDEDEIHIRLADIAKHYGTTFEELIAGGLHALCLLGQDATLCAATGKSGKVEVTNLYRQIYEAAGDIKPKNISVDTLSRAFAGNEIDRVQVYAFAMHMQALAMVAGGSVTVLSHPSLQGIASGTGLSGSTAWHGAFRFRQYLKGVKPEAGEPDSDLREIQFKKNQYGPMGETVVVRYQRGLFLPVPGIGSLERTAQDQKDDELFMTLLDQFDQQGRHVSDKTTAPNYAPTMFGRDAKANGISKARFLAAMERLFAAGKIHVGKYGRPSRPYHKIERKESKRSPNCRG